MTGFRPYNFRCGAARAGAKTRGPPYPSMTSNGPRDDRGLEVSYFFAFCFFFSFLFGGGIGFKMTRSRRTTRARGTCTDILPALPGQLLS